MVTFLSRPRSAAAGNTGRIVERPHANRQRGLPTPIRRGGSMALRRRPVRMLIGHGHTDAEGATEDLGVLGSVRRVGHGDGLRRHAVRPRADTVGYR